MKKSDDDIYDLDDNSYVVDREPVLYTAKKDDQLFSSKILCPKMLLSKCFLSLNSNNQSEESSSRHNSCLYNKILESDNLKLKQHNNEKKVDSDSLAVISQQHGEPNIKAAASILSESNAASSISDVVHQKKEILNHKQYNPSTASSSLSDYLIEKNFKFIFIGLTIVFLVSLTSLCLTMYVLIKRRNHIVYQPTDGYPQDER